MKKILWFICLSLFLVAGFTLTAFESNEELPEPETEIKELIETSYINGAFIDLNPEAMEQGFHEDFAIYSPDGEKISKYPIDRWVESVRSRKNSPNFDPAGNR